MRVLVVFVADFFGFVVIFIDFVGDEFWGNVNKTGQSSPACYGSTGLNCGGGALSANLLFNCKHFLSDNNQHATWRIFD